ncbi:MAG: hypothetical protein M0Z25_06515 [Nitrospiraceae bacterium]|nr:hypothetical protein [Nitrospiraceae bacterium]
MIRVLLVECLLGAIAGAIAFRLTFAASRSPRLCWGIALVLVSVAFFLLPSSPDPWMVRELGGVLPGSPLSPLLVRSLHGLCVLTGAWLSWLVIRARIRTGLEENPRFRDFP